MALSIAIQKLRTSAKLSQEQFANMFNVSRQSVQKWENGTATPELSKIIEISKKFGISLDALILDRDARVIEEMRYNQAIKPQYSNIIDWELYSPGASLNEYRQAVDEGLDIEEYKDLFFTVSKISKNEISKKLGDILFKIITEANQKIGYKYNEPSELELIKALRKEAHNCKKVDKGLLESKIYGAWMGRVCGCMLGKTIEGIKTDELVPFLKETNNYPLNRYIYKKDLNDDIYEKYKFPFMQRCYVDDIDAMPADDDTNYTVLAQLIIDEYGKDFTAYDVSRTWLKYQSINSYCTAERVAFCNFVNGYEPPCSAVYKNPYREWIGAQIRADYFGYINPGNPERAAEMAHRDASISHVKNGIYGEMFVAAMLAVAATTSDIEEIISLGLAQIPYTSRLYESVVSVIEGYKNKVPQKECFKAIHQKFDEHTEYGWCHTIPNAMIVVSSLLYGGGDFAKSICMAVETGFDTDCNGATVGSILGMAFGIDSIPEYWTKPFNDTLQTTILGVGTVKISEAAKKTLEHIE